MKNIEKVLHYSIDYLGGVEANYILTNTALEILSYAHPLQNELKNLMSNQIDWSAPGSVHRIQPDEIEGILEGAKIQVFEDFQSLKAQTLIALWTGLELMIEDLFVAWMLNFPDCLNDKEFQNLKIPLSEFCSLDEESRIRKLYKLYIDQKNGAKTLGIGRFEVVLRALGLAGEVTDNISQSIYELNLLRNLFAHQGGRVDLKFRATEFGQVYELGKTFHIHDNPFRGYCSFTINYAETILERIKLKTDAL